MEEFILTYKASIYWIIGVIITVIILRGVTNLFYKWAVRKKKQLLPDENSNILNVLKRILKALWLVLGIIALSFVVVDREKDEIILRNFNIVLYLGAITIFAIVAAAGINIWFKRKVAHKIASNEDPTAYKYLRYVAVFSIYFLGIILALLAFPSMRGIAHTALGGAGVIAIIAGIASQEALANIIGGFFIIIFKPFKIGDLIKVTDTMVGRVTDITLRHTVIRNFEYKMIVIPNSIINKEKLINYDLGELKCCERIEIGISYDSDIDLAKKIMQEECEKHPLILDNRTELEIQEGNPIVKTALIKLDDSSMTIRAWTWEQNYSDSFQLKIDVLESIKKRFDEEGIEIPFPHRTLVMKEEK
ncbi:mechanosensitive ion channel family protein [Marinirhabdus gelatinilytica]|uniref:Mechanosensitive ion channel-like protein n=1 Tax=Marinirhabdus gelatinilytica TaxID=1703343 RepID=A0A370QLE9_9FLAO|nr:mechanosensitive ion channel family protein [Marinirhabdus gelatinilytica]RDK89196.1 mechanosensitive ion channel-like protein [Marinirhabdus gelatinilytica]